MVYIFQFSSGGDVDLHANSLSHCSEINISAQSLQCGEQLCNLGIVNNSLQSICIVGVDSSCNVSTLSGVAVSQDDAEDGSVVAVDGHIDGDDGLASAGHGQLLVSIGGLGNVNQDRGLILLDDLIQLVGQGSEVFYVLVALGLNGQGDVEGLGQVSVAADVDSCVVTIGDVLDLDGIGLSGDLVACQLGAVSQSGGDGAEVGQISQDLVHNALEAFFVLVAFRADGEPADDSLDGGLSAVVTCVQTNQIVSCDVDQLIAFDSQVCGQCVVQNQVSSDVDSQSLDAGDAVVQDISVQDEVDGAVGIADVVQIVADSGAIHVVTILQEGGNIGLVVTGDDGDIAGDAFHSTSIVGIHGGVNDVQGAGGGDGAFHVLTI